MDGKELDPVAKFITEMRSLGAVRVTVGTTIVEFGVTLPPLTVLTGEHQEDAEDKAALERDLYGSA